MRIGIDYRPVTAAPLSGIARQVLALEQALQARSGVEVVRFTAAPQGHAHRQTALCPAQPSPAEGLHRPRERWNFEVQFLPGAIQGAGLAAYVATANTGLPPIGAPGCVRYVQLLHDVFQITLQNYHASALRALAYRLIDRGGISRSLQVAHAIWTPSQYTADAAARLFPQHRAKLAVLPNAVPWVEANAATSLPTGLPARYWLAVGTREPRKNMPWFIEQWRVARAQDAAVPALVLVGHPGDVPEPLRALDGLLWQSNVGDAVLLALYAAAECLWQPSYAEGFGLPVVEALAQGTPVAVATGSALDEITPPDAPRFDPQGSVALQALMLQQAQACRDDAAAAARRDWARRYDLPAYQRRVDELLDALLHGERPA